MINAPDPGPVFPPGRYGRRRDPARAGRRWLSLLLAALVVAAGAAIAVKLYRQYALAPYQARVLSVTDLAEHHVTVTFEVRKPAGEPALCTVLAHTRAREEVGREQVTVPAGRPEETTVRVTHTLTTRKLPATGQVTGCGPAG